MILVGCLAEEPLSGDPPAMPVELVYHVKQAEPAGPFRELDDVRVLVDVVTLDGDRIRAGTEGTVVAIWGAGEAYEVEFPQPMGALATVEAADLVRAGRPVS
jgi:hypothetical protein